MMKDLIFIDTTLWDALSDAALLHLVKNMKMWREKIWRNLLRTYFAGRSYQDFWKQPEESESSCQELRSRPPHVSQTSQTKRFTADWVTSSHLHDWTGRTMTSPSQHTALCTMFMMSINHVRTLEELSVDFWFLMDTDGSSSSSTFSISSPVLLRRLELSWAGEEIWRLKCFKPTPTVSWDILSCFLYPYSCVLCLLVWSEHVTDTH